MGIDGRDSQVGINEMLVTRKCQIPRVKTSARRNRRKMVPSLGESKGRHVHFPKGWRPHSIKKMLLGLLLSMQRSPRPTGRLHSHIPHYQGR